MLIDKEEKQIEYFDPVYKKMSNVVPQKLNLFQRKYFKGYKLIVITDLTPHVFQDKIDAYSGLCITWCILYVHFRLINADIDFKKVLKEIHKYITKNTLLKYAKLVSRVVKGYTTGNITMDN
jgi:hypothetical protein